MQGKKIHDTRISQIHLRSPHVQSLLYSRESGLSAVKKVQVQHSSMGLSQIWCWTKSWSQMHVIGLHWSSLVPKKGKLLRKSSTNGRTKKQGNQIATKIRIVVTWGQRCTGHLIPSQWPPLSWKMKLFHGGGDVLDVRLWSGYFSPWQWKLLR